MILPSLEPVPVSRKRVNAEEHQTPQGLDVMLHYERLGIDERWNGTDRVDRLCNSLKITHYELADIIRIPHADMTRWRKSGKFPSTVCLWFSLVEFCFFNHLVTDAVEGELIPWSKLKNEQD